MEYSFDIEEAKKYGVNEAIMLRNFKFWIQKNVSNEKNFYDNQTWTFNSVKAFNKLFSFWSESQIKRILKSLIDQKILITGNYNEKKYDRTLWYAYPEFEKSLRRNRQMEGTDSENGLDESIQPIPDVNSDVNQIKFDNYSDLSAKESLGQIKTSSETPRSLVPSKKQHSLSDSKTSSRDSRRASGSADKTKEPNPEFKAGWEFLDYVSKNCKKLKSHRPGSQVYDNAARKLCALMNGRFGPEYKVNEDYKKNNEISRRLLLKRWTKEEILWAIDNYEELLNDKHGKQNDSLPKNLNTFLFNEHSGSAVFLTKVECNYRVKIPEKPLNPDILTKYRATFFKTGTNSTEEQELIRCVNFVIRREREYRKKVEGVLNLTKIMGDKFFDMHIKFLSDIYIDRNRFQLHYIGNKYHWKDYVIWIKREYGDVYDLDPDERFLEKQRIKNESTSALDKELEEARKKRERLAIAFGYDLDGPIPAF